MADVEDFGRGWDEGDGAGASVCREGGEDGQFDGALDFGIGVCNGRQAAAEAWSLREVSNGIL